MSDFYKKRCEMLENIVKEQKKKMKDMLELTPSLIEKQDEYIELLEQQNKTLSKQNKELINKVNKL